MGWIVAIAAALGGLAFWRRKTLKEDAEKVKAAGSDAVAKVKERVQPGADATEAGDGDEAAEATTTQPGATPPAPGDEAADTGSDGDDAAG